MRSKKIQSEEEMVKCSLRLPEKIWRGAKIRAIDERTEFQIVVARALEMYLKAPPKRRSIGGKR